MANSKLNQAKADKNDEFYTQMPDIEAELEHYSAHFKGKVVFCNCDDPRVSNFVRYFMLKFRSLGLKRLIATCYKNQDIDLFSQNDCEQAVYMVYDGAWKGNMPDWDAVEIHELKGDGDFRSDECIALLKQSDIVCTNPPFSLFRQYIAQLLDYKKQFLILGRMTAIHYKEVFPYILAGKVWMGVGFNLSMVYQTSYENTLEANKKFVRSKGYDPDKNYIKVPAICWFTNLDHKKRHEELVLFRRYNPEDYPRYFNFDGINVKEVSDIPCDYPGMMGVPDTLLGQFNPDQFELIGLGTDVPKTMEHVSYKKLGVIRYEKDGVVFWETPYTVSERKIGNSLRIERDGKPGENPYSRIIVRLKKPFIQ